MRKGSVSHDESRTVSRENSDNGGKEQKVFERLLAGMLTELGC